MPQMSPMWWSSLFLEFLALYFVITMIMYSHNIYNTKNNLSVNGKKPKNANWKW